MSINDMPHIETQAAPDPASIKWVPVQGPALPPTAGQVTKVLTVTTDGAAPTWSPPAAGGASITYVGAYDPAHTYHDGDYVIGSDGITYQCVKEGTLGVTPTPWVSPLTGIPQPVVNGQWIKGVGGVPVWAALTPSDVANIPYGTSLPASPYDGQEAILVDSLTNPSYQWRFRYNIGSISAYKWEFIGGAPKIFNYNQNGALMNNAAFKTDGTVFWWVNTATLASVFQVPRSGDYRVFCKQSIRNEGAGAASGLIMAAHFPTSTTITTVPEEGKNILGLNPAWNAMNVVGALLQGATGYVGMAWNGDNGNNFSIRGVYIDIIPMRVS